ncbi:MAG: hypothetical protein ACLTEX_00735 [Eggerthella lenta]
MTEAMFMPASIPQAYTVVGVLEGDEAGEVVGVHADLAATCRQEVNRTKSWAVSSTKVGKRFFMPMGEQPPCT